MTSTGSARRQSNSFRAVLGNRDFRYLWAAGGLDNSGRWMEAVVMGLLVLELTDSPFQVALLFVFRWTPMLLMSLLSGMFADRANRWLLMVTSRTLIWAVIATLTVLVAIGELLPWHLFLGSLLLGWLYVLEFPSRRSFIYELVGGREIVKAMSLETITVTIGRFIGPISAGFIVEFEGYTTAFLLLTMLYGLAWVFTVLVKSRIPARSSGPFNFWATASSGIRYAWSNRIIRSVLGFTMIMNALAFSVESLFPVVARDHLRVGEGLTGVLIASQSIGTLVAALGIGIFSGSAYHGRVFCVGLVHTIGQPGALRFLSLVSPVVHAAAVRRRRQRRVRHHAKHHNYDCRYFRGEGCVAGSFRSLHWSISHRRGDSGAIGRAGGCQYRGRDEHRAGAVPADNTDSLLPAGAPPHHAGR